MNEEFTIAAIFNRTKYRFIVYLCAKIIKFSSEMDRNGSGEGSRAIKALDAVKMAAMKKQINMG